MTYDIHKYVEAYTNVKDFMESLPRSLWPILLPATPGGLPDLELNIVNFKARAVEREQVMALQRLCEMPLRPNERLGEAKAKARLRGKQKDKLLDRIRRRPEEGSV